MEFNKRKIKVFIISGKAKSGKNEVSEIIEKYYNEKNYKSITLSFGSYIKEYVKKITNWDGNEKTKPREVLQQVGIELIKNQIDDKLVIRRILEDISVFSYFYDIILISDARLKDEVELIKSNYPDSISIRISSNEENGLTIEQKKHLTEIDLDNYNNFDYFITNNYNHEDLEKQIYNILNEVNHE